MIPKSCRLFGQDHATKQVIGAKWRFDLIPFRSNGTNAAPVGRALTKFDHKTGDEIDDLG
jgi:hypothetical protein